MPRSGSPLTSRRSVLTAAAGALVLHAGMARSSPWPPAQSGRVVEPPALDDVLESGSRVGALHSIAVVRDGQLVAERAYGGGGPNTLFRINSATKSVSSMLVGIALAQGRLGSLSQTLGELLPDAAAAQPGSAAVNVTLRQVLTGTTGLSYQWRTQFRALARSPDPVQYAFALARDSQAADTWSYNDAAVGLIAPILERAYGQPMPQIARRHLFEPLGIDAFEWQRDGAGRAMAYAGLRLQVRDLLKLAWVMADGGSWQGTQVLPADWVAESTRRHVGGAWPNPPIADSGYGYLWFTGSYQGVPVAWAWGYGAQFALLAPSLRVVVATAASEPPPEQLPVHNQAVATLVGRILESFM